MIAELRRNQITGSSLELIQENPGGNTPFDTITSLQHTSLILDINGHACKTSAHARGLYFQNGGCECELHCKNALFF